VSGEEKVDDGWDSFMLEKEFVMVGFALSEISRFN
jgi:hypothetical protein